LISILLVDDQPVVRDGLKVIFEAQEDMQVVSEAADGAEAVEHACRLAPDVVVMDVRMPGMDGIEATRVLTRRADRAPRILVLTTFGEDRYIYDALKAGASRRRRSPAASSSSSSAAAPRGTGRRPRSPSSHHASSTSPGSSPRGSRTRRSPPTSSSAPPPRSPTSGTSSTSWASATASTSSCSPTKADWSNQASGSDAGQSDIDVVNRRLGGRPNPHSRIARGGLAAVAQA
jgi:DNA-binding NarL/FixJ family response regulator